MRIRCGFRIAHECSQPVPMLLALSLHPSREQDLLTRPKLRTVPDLDEHPTATISAISATGSWPRRPHRADRRVRHHR